MQFGTVTDTHATTAGWHDHPGIIPCTLTPAGHKMQRARRPQFVVMRLANGSTLLGFIDPRGHVHPAVTLAPTGHRCAYATLDAGTPIERLTPADRALMGVFDRICVQAEQTGRAVPWADARPQ
jgi:hypothetical protein